MKKTKGLKRILLGILIIILIIPSLFVSSLEIHQSSLLKKNKNSYRIWVNEDKRFVLLKCVADIANNDMELHMFKTYWILQDFFKNCATPLDFYNRVNESIEDAEFFPDVWFSFFLPKLVYLIKDGHARLWCTQQTILIAAGVKAVFSHWDNSLGKYVLNRDVGGFRFEFWASCDETMLIPIRASHMQLVVDTWNGDTTPMGYEKLEIDPWMNQFREWKPENEKHPVLVSVMYTRDINKILEI